MRQLHRLSHSLLLARRTANSPAEEARIAHIGLGLCAAFADHPSLPKLEGFFST